MVRDIADVFQEFILEREVNIIQALVRKWNTNEGAAMDNKTN